MAEGFNPPPKASPLKITNPEQIPAKRYYDQDFYELENELFWPRVWQMACRLEEIPEVGDWVEYKNLDKSVIVVRTTSGVKAFHNACRHRGMQLASGRGNCETQGFICPFHGWRFNIDGENTFVLGRHVFSPESLEAAELNLVPCRVDFWGGCAFINWDDDAPPLLDTIKPAADRLDPRNVDKLKVEWWLAADLPVNWKLAMEAFMEGYHLLRTHPQIYEMAMPGQDRYGPEPDGKAPKQTADITTAQFLELTLENLHRLSVGMAGMIHASEVEIARDLAKTIELPDDPVARAQIFFSRLNTEIMERGRARGLPVPDLNDLAANNPPSYVEFIFPHYFLLPTFGNMSSYRIRPLGPERCLFELWSLILVPEGEERAPPEAPQPMAHDDPSWPPIPKQDYANLPLQQQGLHAKGFEYMRLARDVEGMISNYQRVIDGFIEGVSSDKLTKAIRTLTNGLDDHIRDLGL